MILDNLAFFRHFLRCARNSRRDDKAVMAAVLQTRAFLPPENASHMSKLGVFVFLLHFRGKIWANRRPLFPFSGQDLGAVPRAPQVPCLPWGPWDLWPRAPGAPAPVALLRSSNRVRSGRFGAHFMGKPGCFFFFLGGGWLFGGCLVCVCVFFFFFFFFSPGGFKGKPQGAAASASARKPLQVVKLPCSWGRLDSQAEKDDEKIESQTSR